MGPHQISFSTYYMRVLKVQFLCILHRAPRSNQFLHILYGGPLRSFFSLTIWGPLISVSSHIIWGPLQISLSAPPPRSVSTHTIWGPPQISFFAYYMGPLKISFFAYYMGAPSDQFLRIPYGPGRRAPSDLFLSILLYGGPLISVSSLTIWGPPKISFFAYYMGALQISFFVYHIGASLDQFLCL